MDVPRADDRSPRPGRAGGAEACGRTSSTRGEAAACGRDEGEGSGVGADLERGVGDIRRSDPGFDPVRLSGYTAMTFRDVQAAWMKGDVASLRPRVTPEIHAELEVQCDRLRGSRRSNRVEEIEIRAEITEAWQESGRDYVTAYISGSMVDYIVDDVSDALVDGSRTKSRRVEEFWTFTRPAGLNFWMLSDIQTS